MIEQPGYLIKTSNFSVGVPTEYLGMKRSDVKLLSLNSRMGTYSIQSFMEIIGMFREGDLLVFNNSSIVKSSLIGYQEDYDRFVRVNFGYNEKGLIAELRDREHTYNPGDSIKFVNGSVITLKERLEKYERFWKISISDRITFDRLRRESGDFIIYGENSPRYPGSVYNSSLPTTEWSVEYPSASRPFTNEVLSILKKKHVGVATVTIHCNLGSLDASEFLHQDSLLPEYFDIPDETASILARTREKGGRIIAVGTSVVRALTTVRKNGEYRTGRGFTSIFIDQDTDTGLDGIVTGMHDPTTSHLLLISAFADLSLIRGSYEAANEHGFHWHEFGDITLIMPS